MNYAGESYVTFNQALNTFNDVEFKSVTAATLNASAINAPTVVGTTSVRTPLLQLTEAGSTRWSMSDEAGLGTRLNFTPSSGFGMNLLNNGLLSSEGFHTVGEMQTSSVVFTDTSARKFKISAPSSKILQLESDENFPGDDVTFRLKRRPGKRSRIEVTDEDGIYMAGFEMHPPNKNMRVRATLAPNALGNAQERDLVYWSANLDKVRGQFFHSFTDLVEADPEGPGPALTFASQINVNDPEWRLESKTDTFRIARQGDADALTVNNSDGGLTVQGKINGGGTSGDLFVGSGLTMVPLPGGTEGQVLTMLVGLPTWLPNRFIGGTGAQITWTNTVDELDLTSAPEGSLWGTLVIPANAMKIGSRMSFKCVMDHSQNILISHRMFFKMTLDAGGPTLSELEFDMVAGGSFTNRPMEVNGGLYVGLKGGAILTFPYMSATHDSVVPTQFGSFENPEIDLTQPHVFIFTLTHDIADPGVNTRVFAFYMETVP